MTFQPDDLHRFDAQQAAQDAFPPPITLADVSDVEKEALALLRLAPRMASLFVALFGTGALQDAHHEVQASLLSKGLVERVPTLDGFVRLTPDGARLQAELFALGGGS